jgi:hypothetical protein
MTNYFEGNVIELPIDRDFTVLTIDAFYGEIEMHGSPGMELPGSAPYLGPTLYSYVIDPIAIQHKSRLFLNLLYKSAKKPSEGNDGTL